MPVVAPRVDGHAATRVPLVRIARIWLTSSDQRERVFMPVRSTDGLAACRPRDPTHSVCARERPALGRVSDHVYRSARWECERHGACCGSDRTGLGTQLASAR